MNDDRCYHIPISPGQKMCTCMDYTVWLRTVVAVQAEVIADQERRMEKHAPRVLTPLHQGDRLTEQTPQRGIVMNDWFFEKFDPESTRRAYRPLIGVYAALLGLCILFWALVIGAVVFGVSIFL